MGSLRPLHDLAAIAAFNKLIHVETQHVDFEFGAPQHDIDLVQVGADADGVAGCADEGGSLVAGAYHLLCKFLYKIGEYCSLYHLVNVAKVLFSK